MKLAISNIAWTADEDHQMYSLMEKSGFQGLEIAPTRIFPQNPYQHVSEAANFSKNLREKYNLNVISMQSIWYGKTEEIFKSKEDREHLLMYTKKAIDFSYAMECGNLVFGCPKNRNLPANASEEPIIDFLLDIGNYAKKRGVVFSIEANPPLYHTNFINETKQAISFCKQIKSEGIGINLDLGTMIINNESIEDIVPGLNYVHHVHVSEPNLEKIKKRELHKTLYYTLKENKYNQYVSIEMKRYEDLSSLKKTMQYIVEVFGNDI